MRRLRPSKSTSIDKPRWATINLGSYYIIADGLTIRQGWKRNTLRGHLEVATSRSYSGVSRPPTSIAPPARPTYTSHIAGGQRRTVVYHQSAEPAASSWPCISSLSQNDFEWPIGAENTHLPDKPSLDWGLVWKSSRHREFEEVGA